MFKLITLYFLWLLMTHHLLAKKHSICTYISVPRYKVTHCADCAGMELEDIPTDLDANIDGLALSRNSIRILSNDSFFPYPSIKLLRADNAAIMSMDSHALAPLTHLEALDLSNGPLEFNFSNFHFPASLRELSLNGIAPTSQLPSSLSGLTFLSMSKCKLDDLSLLSGIFPALEELKISRNPLRNLKIENLAPLCNLKTLRLPSESDMRLKNECECARLFKWVEDHDIKVDNQFCKITKSLNGCNLEPSQAVLDTYNSCKFKALKTKVFSWVVILGSIFTAICLLVVLYLYCNYGKAPFSRCCCCSCCKKKPVVSVKI